MHLLLLHRPLEPMPEFARLEAAAGASRRNSHKLRIASTMTTKSSGSSAELTGFHEVETLDRRRVRIDRGPSPRSEMCSSKVVPETRELRVRQRELRRGVFAHESECGAWKIALMHDIGKLTSGGCIKGLTVSEQLIIQFLQKSLKG